MSDRDLAALIPPRAPAAARRRGWRCPDEERLAAYVEGTLAADARESSRTTWPTARSAAARSGSSPAPASSARRPRCPAISSPLARGERAVAGRPPPSRPRSWRRRRPRGRALLLVASLQASRGRSRPLARRPRRGRDPAGRAPSGSSAPAAAGRRSGIVRPAEGESVPRAALELRVAGGPRRPLLHRAARRPRRATSSGRGAPRARASRSRPAAALVPGQPLLRLGPRPPPERRDREVAGGGLPSWPRE